jgi:hypothetical protein
MKEEHFISLREGTSGADDAKDHIFLTSTVFESSWSKKRAYPCSNIFCQDGPLAFDGTVLKKLRDW